MLVPDFVASLLYCTSCRTGTMQAFDEAQRDFLQLFVLFFDRPVHTFRCVILYQLGELLLYHCSFHLFVTSALNH
eukprot:m.1673929 g.1673929  ORF g.1673929 m.1673929 type:complete len:75 (+) comp178740_c0_seq1:138-362(+)